MRRCCDEHTRAELLRRAAAEAGRGLPPIEAGMPLPAGTGLSRRTFVAASAGLLLSVFGGGVLRLRAFDEGIAAAATAGAADDRVLVSVFLDGGVDSFNLLAPVTDATYRKLRPKLGLTEGDGPTFAQDSRLMWHPKAAALAELHGEGKVCVATALGYTDGDQSHFTSRHFYEVGARERNLQTGWLGRYLDLTGSPDNPLQGLSLDYALQPSLATAKHPVASVESPDGYALWATNVWDSVESRMLEALSDLGRAAIGTDPVLAQVGATALHVDGIRRALAPFAPKDDKPSIVPPVAYPEGDHEFPKRLSGLAALLAAGLPIRCVALTAPGAYDTHDSQPGALAEGLDLTSRTLLAFQRDLEARGIADRVLTLVWSEFGRRAEENSSEGTDHGAAGAGFVIGSRASGQLIGEFPGVAEGLDDEGNLRPTADFRGLYAALLEQWLQFDAAAVIPEAASFARPVLVR